MAYIDAEKLCDNLRLMAKYQYPDKRNTILGVVSTIENTPSADVVEVKHGEWAEKDCITESNRGRTIHYVTNKCSVCGKWNGRHKSNYCPNCGAKMDGGKTK